MSKKASRSGTICCAINCNARGGHSFPSEEFDPERRKQWEIAVRRNDEHGKPWKAKQCNRICSRHFREEDYFPVYDAKGK